MKRFIFLICLLPLIATAQFRQSSGISTSEAGGISSLADDPNPKLAGDLDTDGFAIDDAFYDAYGGFWYQKLLPSDFISIGSWPADDTFNGFANDTILTNLVDQSGNGNDMFTNGQPLGTNFGLQTFAILDGIDDSFQVNNPFHSRYNITILAVFALINNTSDNEMPLSQANAVREWFVNFRRVGSAEQFFLEFSVQHVGTPLSTQAYIPTDAMDWEDFHLWGFSYGKAFDKIYLDGRLIAQKDVSGISGGNYLVADSTDPLVIGSFGAGVSFKDMIFADLEMFTNNFVMSDAQHFGIWKGFYETNYPINNPYIP